MPHAYMIYDKLTKEYLRRYTAPIKAKALKETLNRNPMPSIKVPATTLTSRRKHLDSNLVCLGFCGVRGSGVEESELKVENASHQVGGV